jgi:hypothetical protein
MIIGEDVSDAAVPIPLFGMRPMNYGGKSLDIPMMADTYASIALMFWPENKTSAYVGLAKT